jgi:hypothetical protein
MGGDRMPDLKDQLFPDGMPTVEEFISKIAEYVRELEERP